MRRLLTKDDRLACRYVPNPLAGTIRPKDLEAVVYLYTSPKSGKPGLVAYSGSKSRPDIHEAYRDEGQRAKRIEAYFAGLRRIEEYRAETRRKPEDALTGANRGYLTCAQTAQLLRAHLARAFPGVRFGVRSHTYANGASIDVSWVDGPTAPTVKEIARDYAGASFDGMIDLKQHHTSWLLPDGTVTLAHAPGTIGSMGIEPEIIRLPPHPDAKPIHLGADYVFCHRNLSRSLLAEAVQAYRNGGGESAVEIRGDDRNAHLVTDDYHAQREILILAGDRTA